MAKSIRFKAPPPGKSGRSSRPSTAPTSGKITVAASVQMPMVRPCDEPDADHLANCETCRIRRALGTDDPTPYIDTRARYADTDTDAAIEDTRPPGGLRFR